MPLTTAITALVVFLLIAISIKMGKEVLSERAVNRQIKERRLRREAFEHHVGFYPSLPNQASTSRTISELIFQAERVQELHYAWQKQIHRHAPASFVQSSKNAYDQAVEAFDETLILAIEFNYVSNRYNSYHQLVSPRHTIPQTSHYSPGYEFVFSDN
jgi:hypothetical protein